MVYVEKKWEAIKYTKFCNYYLGKDKVKKTVAYVHVSLEIMWPEQKKGSVVVVEPFPAGTGRTLDVRTVRTMYVHCTSSTRWVNAVTSIGIKSKGVCTAIWTTVFWAIIMPIVTYGSELWVLRSDEVKLLRKFQRYVGPSLPNVPEKVTQLLSILSPRLDKYWLFYQGQKAIITKDYYGHARRRYLQMHTNSQSSWIWS